MDSCNFSLRDPLEGVLSLWEFTGSPTSAYKSHSGQILLKFYVHCRENGGIYVVMQCGDYWVGVSEINPGKTQQELYFHS